MRRLAIFLAVGFFLSFSPAANALVEAAATPEKYFTDLDGDGLNDNLLDIQDGYFLQEADTARSVHAGGIGGEVIDAFSSFDFSAVDLPQTNNEAFVSRKFEARSASTCRGDFDADFGGSTGSSGSSGKTCIGGVCF